MNFALIEVLDDSTNFAVEIPICGYPRAEAVGPSYGFTIAKPLDVGKQIGQCAHTP